MIYNSINDLRSHIFTWKDLGLTTVLCHGCFDPLHAGHIDYFKQSKAEGHKLIVSVIRNPYLEYEILNITHHLLIYPVYISANGKLEFARIPNI